MAKIFGDLNPSQDQRRRQDLRTMAFEVAKPRDWYLHLYQSPSPRWLAAADPFSSDLVSEAIGAEQGGAVAMILSTEEKTTGGTLGDIAAIREAIHLPIIRWDRILNDAQIYESRVAGADSYVLFAQYLDAPLLQYLIEVGRELDMEPLVTARTADLPKIFPTDAKVILLLDTEQNLGRVRQKADQKSEHERLWIYAAKDLEQLPSRWKDGFCACLKGGLYE